MTTSDRLLNRCRRCPTDHDGRPLREGHSLTTGMRPSAGYMCVCGTWVQGLDEWHDHLIGAGERDAPEADVSGIAQRLGVDPTRWAQALADDLFGEGAPAPYDGKPGGVIHTWVVAMMEAVEEASIRRAVHATETILRMTAVELERRGNGHRDQFFVKLDPYYKGSMDAYADAVDVVRKAGGLGEDHERDQRRPSDGDLARDDLRHRRGGTP